MPNTHKNPNTDPLHNTTAAAAYLDENPSTLANQRSRGEGPTYIKLGHHVKYRQSDLDAYIESCIVRLQKGAASA
jgi:hypothetical protein